MPVILATWEAKVGDSQIHQQPEIQNEFKDQLDQLMETMSLKTVAHL